MERRIVNPWTWQDRRGFVQANEISGAQRILFCSGQTPVDPDGKPMHAGDMAAQIRLALGNLETVLGEAGFGLADVVHLRYYVTDVDAFREVREAAGGRLAGADLRPAQTLLGVSRLAHPSMMVEIEATAVR